MTKKELLKFLEPFDDDTEVMMYWKCVAWPVHEISSRVYGVAGKARCEIIFIDFNLDHDDDF